MSRPAVRHGAAGTAGSAPALPPGAWGLRGAGRGGLRLALTIGLVGAGRCGAAFLVLRPVRGAGGSTAAAAERAGRASAALGGGGEAEGRRRGLRGSRRRTGEVAWPTGRIKAKLSLRKKKPTNLKKKVGSLLICYIVLGRERQAEIVRLQSAGCLPQHLCIELWKHKMV